MDTGRNLTRDELREKEGNLCSRSFVFFTTENCIGNVILCIVCYSIVRTTQSLTGSIRCFKFACSSLSNSDVFII